MDFALGHHPANKVDAGGTSTLPDRRWAFCGSLYTFTIIVSVTDIIFVVRYRFKGIKYDFVMYTKNAAQCTIHTQTPEFPAGL